MINSCFELSNEKDLWSDTLEVSKNEKLSLIFKVFELCEKLSFMSKETYDIKKKILVVFIDESNGKRGSQ